MGAVPGREQSRWEEGGRDMGGCPGGPGGPGGPSGPGGPGSLGDPGHPGGPVDPGDQGDPGGPEDERTNGGEWKIVQCFVGPKTAILPWWINFLLMHVLHPCVYLQVNLSRSIMCL